MSRGADPHAVAPPGVGVSRLPVRVRGAVAAGRAAGWLSRTMGRGGGTTMPGRVGLMLAPDLLPSLSRDRTVLLVSGTNGKTTTSRYLAAAVGSRREVLTSQGANLLSGIATVLLSSREDPRTTAVLEVDELALPAATKALDPAVVVLLNLSRDQLDRTGEVATHVERWIRGLESAPRAVVVANADDPLVVTAVLGARPSAQGVLWVGAGQPWRRDAPLCPRCGAVWTAATESWECGACGLARPAASWQVTGDGLVAPDAELVRADLGLPGRANVANAAMAAAAAACLDVPVDASLAAMREVTDVAGRYLRTQYAGSGVRLLLAKNPAGWAEVLAELEERSLPVVLSVNARVADSTDTSWLWDVPFERLRGRQVVATGERAADLSLRLLYAGVEHTRQPDALRALELMDCPEVDVAANYTAFTSIRDRLLAARRHDRQRPSEVRGR